MRLDKLLCNLKYGSRSEIKTLVKKGYCTVNGNVVKNSDYDVKETDEIIFDDEVVYHKENIYLMLNKPRGYICATHDGLHKTVLELIGDPFNRYDLIIVGRLDIDTEGLLLLTNDGLWAHSIISPRKEHYKKYYVKLRKPLGNYQELLSGVTILDGNNLPYKTLPAMIEKISDDECYISICEGKFHQVKRMMEYIDNEVIYLKRVKINNLSLGDLKIGEYREISKEEILY